MAPRNKVLQLGEQLLTPEHIEIAKEIVQKHFDGAVSAKDQQRIRKVSALLTLVEEVEEEFTKP